MTETHTAAPSTGNQPAHPQPEHRFARVAGFLMLLSFLWLGDMLGVSQISPTINYNYMNGGFLYLALGLLFWACGLLRSLTSADSTTTGASNPGSGESAPARKAAPMVTLLIAAGFFAGFDLFVKFTSSVLFVPMAAVLLWFQMPEKPSSFRLRTLVPLLTGYALGILTFFVCIYPFDAWWQNFSASLHSQAGGTHSPLHLINKQIGDFKRIGLNLLQFYLLPLGVLMAIGWRFLRNPTSRWWIVLPITLLLCVFPAWHLYKLVNFRFYTLFYLSIILALLLTHGSIGNRALWQDGRKVSALLALWLLPFLLMAGSNASFSYSIPLYLAPWFGIIALLLWWLPPFRFRLATAVLLVLLVEAQFVPAYLYYPWRWVDHRLAQTELVQGVQGLKGIRVDPATFAFITETRRIVAQAPAYHPPPTSKFPPGYRPMIGLYGLPGPVYWLGGASPGLPWFSADKHEQGHTCRSLQAAAATEDLSQALLLIQDEAQPEMRQCLDNLDLKAADYREIGRARSPYTNLDVVFYARKEASRHD